MAPSDRPPLPVRLGRYARRELAPVERRVAERVQQATSPVGRPEPATATRQLGRHLRWSACYAPSTSLYLDQFGKVRACCQNTGHLLGDLATETLREIWDGHRTATLRDALARDDLGLGCEFCAWQRTEADPDAWFLRAYDELPSGLRTAPRWPEQLEFSVSNTCNLQCVMCNGDWSSAIRAQREHRPKLPSAYPDRVFDELVEFAPHLRRAHFTGGEPFLGTEPQRILAILATHGGRDLVAGIVTNGTIWNDRVEQVLAGLRCHIVVSIDGGTAEAYERIRVGASFTEVLANVDRFLAALGRHGAGLNLTHCLMVDNWATFPELLRLAEERDLEVDVNVVRFPIEHSLYQLPAPELLAVVRALDARTTEVERSVTGGRLRTWHAQLEALRARAEAAARPTALGEVPVRLGGERTDEG